MYASRLFALIGLAAAAASACSYPDFQYGTDAGAAGGGGGQQTSTVRVPCINGSLCAAGQLCCFDAMGTADTCDECADPGDTCGADRSACKGATYAKFTCVTDDDCDGQI